LLKKKIGVDLMTCHALKPDFIVFKHRK